MAQSRQLAAIMFTDIVGYTALMEQDERYALDILKKNLLIHRSVIDAFGGRLVKELGDGILASFTTVSDALNAAINIQKQCNETNQFKLSIGIHQGEVVFEEGDIFGDAVNVASRIQSLGTAGSILFSKKLADEVKNKIEFQTASLGSFEFKNVNEPVVVFALANEGFPIPRRASMQGKLKERFPKRVVFTTLVSILVIASALLIYENFLFTNNVAEGGKSIAVLPFENMSNDPDQEYFSDGMTDQIITSLAKLKVLDVIGRTSMMHYKGSQKTIPEIAKELNNVSYVLEGSIQKSGNRIKVNVQLIRSRDNFHQWAEVYDRDLTDIFAVQDELSAKIAKALLGELHPDQKELIKPDRPAIVEAYEYYLKGVHFHSRLVGNFAMEDFQLAEQMLLKAITLDPGYASAYGALADLYDTRGNDPSYKKYWNLRDSVVRIAYKMNPQSGYVLYSLGLTYYKRQNPDLDSALYYFQKAYEIDSSNFILNTWFGLMLTQIGLPEKAVPILKKVLILDPTNISARNELSNSQFISGDMTNAEINYKKILETDMGNLNSQVRLAYISLFYKNDINGVQQLYQAPMKIDPNSSAAKVISSWLLAKDGKKQEALRQGKGMVVYSLLRMKKEAIQKLDSLTKARPYENPWGYQRIKSDKSLDFIRNEPEFQTILLREKKIYEERLAKYGHLFE